MTDEAMTQMLKMMQDLQKRIDKQDEELKVKNDEIQKLKSTPPPTPPNTGNTGGLKVEEVLNRLEQEESKKLTPIDKHMEVAIDSLIRYQRKIDGKDPSKVTD